MVELEESQRFSERFTYTRFPASHPRLFSSQISHFRSDLLSKARRYTQGSFSFLLSKTSEIFKHLWERKSLMGTQSSPSAFKFVLFRILWQPPSYEASGNSFILLPFSALSFMHSLSSFDKGSSVVMLSFSHFVFPRSSTGAFPFFLLLCEMVMQYGIGRVYLRPSVVVLTEQCLPLISRVSSYVALV